MKEHTTEINVFTKPIVNGNRKDVLMSCENKLDNHAGFSSRSKLVSFLNQEIFGFGDKNKLEHTTIDDTKVISNINKTLEKCKQKIAISEKLHVHCFPSYNSFINTKMGGVSGYTSDKNNIFLFISPQSGWQKQLRYTVAHEYAHTFAYKYHGWKTLLDSLVFEGITEHFRQSVLGGKISPWSKSIPPKECKETFGKIYKNLQNTQEKYYQQIFLGFENKYPLWTGYAIGYQIIKSYLAKHKNMSWPEIMKEKTEDILTKSQYIKAFSLSGAKFKKKRYIQPSL